MELAHLHRGFTSITQDLTGYAFNTSEYLAESLDSNIDYYDGTVGASSASVHSKGAPASGNLKRCKSIKETGRVGKVLFQIKILKTLVLILNLFHSIQLVINFYQFQN